MTTSRHRPESCHLNPGPLDKHLAQSFEAGLRFCTVPSGTATDFTQCHVGRSADAARDSATSAERSASAEPSLIARFRLSERVLT